MIKQSRRPSLGKPIIQNGGGGPPGFFAYLSYILGGG